MAAPKFSLITLFILSSCVVAQNSIDVNIKNAAQGCFSLNASKVDLADPVVLNLLVSPNNSGDCSCKSTLLNYSVVQKLEGYENFLISGAFSPLGISELALPLSVQSRIIVQDKPLLVNVTCASN